MKESATTVGDKPFEGWPEEKRGTPEWLAKLRANYGEESRNNKINLSTNHRYALAEFYLFQRAGTEICEKYGFGKNRWARIKKAPEAVAIKEFIESREMPEIIRDLWETESFHISIDLKKLYDWAVESKDYKTAHKIAMDMIGLGGINVGPPKQKSASELPLQLTINIAGTDAKKLLESPTDAVEADYEFVDDE